MRQSWRRESARAALVAVASCLAGGCSGSHAPASATARPAPPNQLPGEVAPAVLPQPSTDARTLARLLMELGERRGLLPSRTPELVELPPAELFEAALERVRRRTPEPERTTAVRLLSTLELVPADFDYFAAVERILRGALQAFYDPDAGVLFVSRALPPGARERAIVHELMHSLQADHFGVGQLWSERDGNPSHLDSDQRAAMHLLAEGDAEYFTERWQLTTADDPAPAIVGEALPDPETPSTLLRALAAPYVDGRAVIERAYAAAGWRAVNALWLSLPRSTHELLHPASKHAPISIATPPGPSDVWQLRSSDVYGEQALRCVLEEWWPELVARQVASAWSGDRLAWFESGQQTALIWQLQFDGAERARAAFDALSEGLRLPGADVRPPAQARAGTLSCRAHRDSGVVAMLSQAEQVWVLGMHGLYTEAACRTLAAWMTRVTPALSAHPTRVGVNSPVRVDPRPGRNGAE